MCEYLDDGKVRKTLRSQNNCISLSSLLASLYIQLPNVGVPRAQHLGPLFIAKTNYSFGNVMLPRGFKCATRANSNNIFMLQSNYLT